MIIMENDSAQASAPALGEICIVKMEFIGLNNKQIGIVLLYACRILFSWLNSNTCFSISSNEDLASRPRFTISRISLINLRHSHTVTWRLKMLYLHFLISCDLPNVNTIGIAIFVRGVKLVFRSETLF